MTRLIQSLGKAGRRTLDVLSTVADGMLYFELNGKYRKAFLRDGLAGMRRVAEYDEKAALRQRYVELRRRKLLVERRIGKRIVAMLTDRGHESFLKLQVRAAKRREDGGRTYVMYDIPERHRTARDAVRTWLKMAGFRLHQRSVWVTERDVAALLKRWVSRRRLGAWIQIVET